MARVIPFAGAKDYAHVVVFPRIGRVREIFVRTIEINIIIVITIEERADVERAAQADEMAHQIGVTKSNIGSVISAEARAADRNAMTIAFAPCEIEHVSHDHVFVSVVRAHPVRGMNRFIVETLKVDGVRAINRDSAGVDVASHGTDESEVFVLIITAERSRKENQRQSAAVAERKHFKLAA